MNRNDLIEFAEYLEAEKYALENPWEDIVNEYLQSQPEPKKSAEEILKKIKRYTDGYYSMVEDKKGQFIKYKDALDTMQEYAQIQSNELWGFFYNGCIHESSYGLMSAHKTKKGAEMAMEFHKAKAKADYDRVYKDHKSEFNIKFGQHEDWCVDKIEIKD